MGYALRVGVHQRADDDSFEGWVRRQPHDTVHFCNDEGKSEDEVVLELVALIFEPACAAWEGAYRQMSGEALGLR